MIETTSHIIPLMVRDSFACKQISDYLLETESIYIQPINYPTVPRGTERLRITPGPYHTDEHMDRLVNALLRAWGLFEVKLAA
jgi:5-aminolevulinate synthase